VFLACYVYYHAHVGSVHFPGQGWVRPLYFGLLLSHTMLAVTVVPLVLLSLAAGLRGRFDRHRRIARWTYPIWLYVSVTGVIVYLMLYRIYGAHA
jgi:putative membrane protein